MPICLPRLIRPRLDRGQAIEQPMYTSLATYETLHSAGVSGLAFFPSGEILIFCGEDGRVCITSMTTAASTFELQGSPFQPASITWLESTSLVGWNNGMAVELLTSAEEVSPDGNPSTLQTLTRTTLN